MLGGSVTRLVQVVSCLRSARGHFILASVWLRMRVDMRAQLRFASRESAFSALAMRETLQVGREEANWFCLCSVYFPSRLLSRLGMTPKQIKLMI